MQGKRAQFVLFCLNDKKKSLNCMKKELSRIMPQLFICVYYFTASGLIMPTYGR